MNPAEPPGLEWFWGQLWDLVGLTPDFGDGGGLILKFGVWGGLTPQGLGSGVSPQNFGIRGVGHPKHFKPQNLGIAGV